MESRQEYVFKEKRFYSFLKRIIDIVLSFLFLVFFGWFILLMMFIKFCEDGHNPIYTSYRVGKKGKLIKFHKIRSMVVNAEEEKSTLVKHGLNEAKGPVFKIKDDPRITKFGKWLRKHSLDELPQIWDIFVGRISIIGPRSPLQEEVAEYTPYQMHRLDVKGGILCTWQISKNRHDIPFEKWIEMDLDYIKRRNLWLDFTILWKAFWFVLFDRTGE